MKKLLLLILCTLCCFQINVNAANKVVKPGDSEYNQFKSIYEEEVKSINVDNSELITLFGHSVCDSEGCEYDYLGISSDFKEVLKQTVKCLGGEKNITYQTTGGADGYKTTNEANYIGEVYWSEDFFLTCTNNQTSDTITLNDTTISTPKFNLESGDIIIGYSKFDENTWISAAKASKAGSLYTKISGDTFVRTFMYVAENVWYELNPETANYEILNQEELNAVKLNTKLYYTNNEPNRNTYVSIYDVEVDEETGAIHPVNINDVAKIFYGYAEYGEILIDDSEVELDYENKTITCPYGKDFEFTIYGNHEGEDYFYEYVATCGFEDFEFVSKEEYDLEKLQINEIKLTEDENLLNQSKVTFNNNMLKINEVLETFTIKPYTYYPDGGPSFEGNFVAFDIEFAENNNCNFYSLNQNTNTSNPYYYSCIDNNTMRLYLDLDTYNWNSFSLVLLDNMFSTYERFYFNINSLERPTYNLTLENIEKVDSLTVSNNSLIHSIDVTSEEYAEGSYQDTIVINTIGELVDINYNNEIAKWVAVDLYLNDEVDYQNLRITLNGYDLCSYEIYNHYIRLYLDIEGSYYRSYYISITDMITNQNIGYSIVLNNYGEEDYIYADNGYDGIYYFANYVDDNSDGNIYRALSNSSIYYELFFDSETNKLYYKNIDSLSVSGILFKDSSTLNRLYINENGRAVVEDNVEIIIEYTEDINGTTQTYHSNSYRLDEYPNLYEYISTDIENSLNDDRNEITKVNIYTFFKPGRVLTEEEEAEFDKFDNLVSQGKVEFIDISSSVY